MGSFDMNKKDWPSYIEIIKREVIPALGCTEPIAVALAASRAAEELGKAPDSIDAFLSGNVLKNGMSVGIPGTGLYGLDTAAAVGAMGGRSELKLEVLKEITPEALIKAKELLAKKVIRIHHKDCPENLYIEVILRSGKDSVRVIIKDLHTNICLVEHNDIVVFENSKKGNESTQNEDESVKMTERNVWDFAMNAPLEDLRFILIASEVNSRISEEGLKGDYGLRIGRNIDESIAKGLLVSDLSNEAVRRTTGGTDARMAGSDLPVICNSGSGNQGITATMPVVAIVEKLGASEEQLIRALILSHLTSIHIKSSMNRLTALCGASVAATGASCGIVYLLGGQYKHIEYAIKNMVGNVAGIICDGAKSACSLKVASCVSAGVQGALLAINGIGVSDSEGIVEGDIERTIANLVHLSSPGMVETDKIILEIMTHKGG